MAQPQSFENAPINWIPAFVLISTPLAALLIVPYYLWTHSVSWQVWAIFAFFMAWNGLSITVGYHRLWSHRTYQAHPIVKWFFLIGVQDTVCTTATSMISIKTPTLPSVAFGSHISGGCSKTTQAATMTTKISQI